MTLIMRGALGLDPCPTGIALCASPEIGGMVTVGFVLFVSGVVLLANVVVDALGVE